MLFEIWLLYQVKKLPAPRNRQAGHLADLPVKCFTGANAFRTLQASDSGGFTQRGSNHYANSVDRKVSLLCY